MRRDDVHLAGAKIAQHVVHLRHRIRNIFALRPSACFKAAAMVSRTVSGGLGSNHTNNYLLDNIRYSRRTGKGPTIIPTP